jgi:hypothetical protein
VELHPAEQNETYSNSDMQGDNSEVRALQFVNDPEQQEAHADRQIPPAPVG